MSRRVHRPGSIPLAAGAVLLLATWTPAPAAADLVECDSPAATFAVFLDEPAVTSQAAANDPALQDFLDELIFFFDEERERAWVEPGQPVGFVLCRGRKPSLSGQEFDSDVVRSLYNRGVVLEVWAKFSMSGGGADAPIQRQATLAFLSVPLRFEQLLGQAAAGDGIHLDRYPKDPAQPLTDFLAAFGQAEDLDVLVAVGLGIRAARERQFDLAQSNLCKAQLLLAQTLAEHADPKLEQVAAYVRRRADENLLQARAALPPDDPLRALLAGRDSACPGDTP